MFKSQIAFRGTRTIGLSFVLFIAPVLAKVITPVPGNFVLDGKIEEWMGIPPTQELRYEGHSTEYNSFWLGQSRKGMVVAGLIRNNPWRFATSTSELSQQGRLEIWISEVDSFDLPEIKNIDDRCAREEKPEDKNNCMQWVQAQTAFRERLQRQAARMWRIAPNAAEEAYALPAYDEFTEPQLKALGFPRPAGLPLREFRTSSDGAVTFEILIPWNLFPPADRLNIERIRLAVNVKTHFYGSPPAGEPLPDDLPAYAVSPPITTRITTCGQPLLGRNMHGEDEPALYFLSPSFEIDKAFFFETPKAQNDFALPGKNDVSPIALGQLFFTQELDTGEFLCGPFMGYRRGQIVRNFPFRLEPPQDQFSEKPLTSFPVMRLADGTRLIRYGPETASGPLWRKAFVTYGMRIYVLTPSLVAYEALSLGAWSDFVPGYEIEVSGDWRAVTEFRMDPSGNWTSETHCLAGHTYRSCGKNPKSEPPRRRILTSDP